MLDHHSIVGLRMRRQHLVQRADTVEYDALYRDTSPGQNVYWNGFGDPPSLTFRADFDDIAYNRSRQKSRTLLKGRFQGGNLGWIERADLELFARRLPQAAAIPHPGAADPLGAAPPGRPDEHPGDEGGHRPCWSRRSPPSSIVCRRPF